MPKGYHTNYKITYAISEFSSALYQKVHSSNVFPTLPYLADCAQKQVLS